jgi:hypothetical protein
MNSQHETYYNATVRPLVKEQVKSFKAELGKEGLCMAYQAAHERKEVVKGRIKMLDAEYTRLTNENQPWVVRSDIPPLRKANEKLLRRLDARMKSIEDEWHGRKPVITEDMKENARAYPLSEIIAVVNNKATCVSPDHKDNTPSMNCKNNFAYCHVCGWTGDPIDVYMLVNGVGFVQAVKEMQ